MNDNDIYFDDGNLVVSAKAGENGEIVYFRIHKSILGKHSPVFKDMYSVPPPPELEQHDGVPLVHVHDDAGDLRNFLKAIYDPSFLPFQRLDNDTPSLVTGPLKLAIKYQADTLRTRITSHLEYCWPTILDDWDSLVRYDGASSGKKAAESNDSESADDSMAGSQSDPFPDPVPYIPLARECKLRGILATIFYFLCCDSKERMKKVSRLEREDLEALMLGRERMMKYICGPATVELEIASWEIEESHWHYYRYGRVVHCSGRTCRIPTMGTWLDIVQDATSHGDPLKTFRSYAQKFRERCDDMDDDWDDGYSYDYNRTEMCKWCEGRMADGLDDLRVTLFAELPNFFAPEMVENSMDD